MRSQGSALPIDGYLPSIVEALGVGRNLVLQAAPGAGKTTRVPWALCQSLPPGTGEVLVLEPRRLAARMAARRVAEELGERLGESVGYQVRFEEVGGRETRLRFVTEGILTRRLLTDPTLRGVGVVVLDEFHERHLQTDLALALLRRLQRGARPDLRLLVMSATLDAGPVATYLGAGDPLEIPGRSHPVTIEYAARPDDRPLAAQVESALEGLCRSGLDGDVLVFLPGAAEIRRAQSACARLAAREDLLVLPLHGELPVEEQERAIRPAGQRKVILSTNVAESSLTIEGVVAVIDSGLARMVGHSPWSGLATHEVGRISQAAAVQRAGRAGRTRPGVCRRLYTQQDFQARPAHPTPEIAREDLAGAVLELYAMGVVDPVTFDWFERPPQAALEAATTLLCRLCAVEPGGGVTPTGRQMLRFPLHPRQSRLLVEAQRRGVEGEAATIAALIGERDILATSLFGEGGARSSRQIDSSSDLLERLDLFAEATRQRLVPEALRELGLDPAATRAVDRVRRQLERLLSGGGRSSSAGTTLLTSSSPDPGGKREEALLFSILAGYPDRVAQRRTTRPAVSGRAAPASAATEEGGELRLATGGGAQLSPRSVVRRAEYLVAIEAAERRDRSGTTGRPLVHLASAIEPDWLIEIAPDAIQETIEVTWNAKTERVEAFERMLYHQMVLDERRLANPHRPEVSQVLAEAALTVGWERFADPEEVYRLLWRIAFIGYHFPELDFPDLGESDIPEALRELCDGLSSFAELRAAAGRGGLVQCLRQRLPTQSWRQLDTLAPESVQLPGRRHARIHYERDQAPWIASRLQDFIGLQKGPRIGEGRVPLVLHLLAPNQRPVQVTTDLAGFWERTYPQVRRELSRRYPRHAWP
jgi:ATP-dependent helicase HrpB